MSQHSARRHWREMLFVAGLALLALWALVTLARRVAADGPVVELDRAIYQALQSLRAPFLDTVLITITQFGDTFVVTAVTLSVAAWLLWRRAPRTALFFASGVGLASVSNSVIKLLIARPRPLSLEYTGISAFSFPSGHATVNAVLYGLLALLVARQVAAWQRVLVFAGAGLWVGLIAFSRLYLGAHWFSDVAASSAFATAFLALGYDVFRRNVFEPYEPWRLARAGLVALLVFGLVHVALSFGRGDARYVPPALVGVLLPDPVQTLPVDARGAPGALLDKLGPSQSAVSAPPLSL